jgi:hypothetical protein
MQSVERLPIHRRRGLKTPNRVRPAFLARYTAKSGKQQQTFVAGILTVLGR